MPPGAKLPIRPVLPRLPVIRVGKMLLDVPCRVFADCCGEDSCFPRVLRSGTAGHRELQSAKIPRLRRGMAFLGHSVPLACSFCFLRRPCASFRPFVAIFVVQLVNIEIRLMIGFFLGIGTFLGRGGCFQDFFLRCS